MIRVCFYQLFLYPNNIESHLYKFNYNKNLQITFLISKIMSKKHQVVKNNIGLENGNIYRNNK